MADYRLSAQADSDIYAIATYTLETWNESQAERYILGHSTFQRLAAKPNAGKRCDDIRPGYFRRRYRSHMIFYKQAQYGILIVRVLHAQMDFLRHL